MKYLKIFLLILFAILFISTASPVQSQDQQMKSDLDTKQDEIQSLYIDTYGIIDQYPNVHYSYVYDNGKVTEVEVIGVPDPYQKHQLAAYLIKLEDLKSELVNLKDASGIYYLTESEPKPKEGYKTLYRNLHENLNYPETAEKYGVEGTVFVKFVVESNGEVKNIHSTNTIDTSYDRAKEELITEAKNAVKATSGNWEPAKVGNIPVDQWVYLPVKFDIENSIYYPIFDY